MGIVGVVVIKGRFQVGERMLIFFARVGDDSQSMSYNRKLWMTG
jgi:acyl-[acyl carrier protein]--UDP-N-acetylglucosamine O-acyltransferase